MSLQWRGLGLGAAVVLLGVVSCRQSQLRSANIRVPGMDDDRAVRIVTNAALDEVVGHYEGPRHACEIDLAKGLVFCHESARLLSADYQRAIAAALRQIGCEGRILKVAHNPPAPVPTVDGPCQEWPDRFTAVIAVSGMTTRTIANRVVDAISFARLGRDSPRVTADRTRRRLDTTYESLRLCVENIEHAIACAGFAANGVPACLGAADAVPHGWEPVTAGRDPDAS